MPRWTGGVSGSQWQLYWSEEQRSGVSRSMAPDLVFDGISVGSRDKATALNSVPAPATDRGPKRQYPIARAEYAVGCTPALASNDNKRQAQSASS